MRKQLTEQDITQAVRKAINEWMNLNVSQQNVQSGMQSRAEALASQIKKNPIAFFTYDKNIQSLIKAAYQNGDAEFKKMVYNACWANGAIQGAQPMYEGIISGIKNMIGGISGMLHNDSSKSGISPIDAYRNGKQMVKDRRAMKDVVGQVVLMCGITGKKLTGLQEILRVICKNGAEYARAQCKRYQNLLKQGKQADPPEIMPNADPQTFTTLWNIVNS